MLGPRRGKEEKEALKSKNKEKNQMAQATAVKVWKKNLIDKNDFIGLRMLPTKMQAFKSMKDWNTGHQIAWDFDAKGFAKISQSENKLKDGERMSHAMVNTGELNLYEGVHYSSGEYFRPGDELEQEFLDYLVDLNYKKAIFYLAEAKKQMKKRLKAEKAAAIEKFNRKRAAVLIQEDLAMDALQAKTSNAVKSGLFKPAGIVDDEVEEDDEVDEQKMAEMKEKERRAKEKEKLEAEEEERDREKLGH